MAYRNATWTAWGVLIGVAVVGFRVAAGQDRTSARVDPSSAAVGQEVPLKNFLALQSLDPRHVEPALEAIERDWRDQYTVMLLETIRLRRGSGPSAKILAVLQRNSGQKIESDLSAWYRWAWEQPAPPHSQYADFKAQTYAKIDPRFAAYFSGQPETTIRLEEVRWGGVGQNGIPPLTSPTLIPAASATYLADSDLVYGVEINGDARAYPKRILGWHELLHDTIGAVSVCGVYCTLCGSMIVYETEFQGVDHELGTSGFLYRSNKLMFDDATNSLWSTLQGQPVVGELVGQRIQLARRPVVTTSWRAWREQHPHTSVLSLETGYQRDYDEGAAYRKYFATDELMFTVPRFDQRLKNKDEVLAIHGPPGDAGLAIADDFLRQHAVYHDKIGDQRIVVITADAGGSRVYQSGPTRFVSQAGDSGLVDDQGAEWQVSETEISDRLGQPTYHRMPAHRAFWFAWINQFPDARLVQ